MVNIPDMQYINKIRENLWSGTIHGKAAVMIGAGFSRNADKLIPDVSPFPLWNHLVTKMCD